MNNAAVQVVAGALASTRLSHDERSFIARWQPAGLTLFRRNFEENEANIESLTHDLQNLYPGQLPPLIAIDQEGGRVRRIRERVPNPGAPLYIEDELTSITALDQIQRGQFEVASRLTKMGINTNFAPVLDIWSHKTHDAIGDRCWGREPQSVSLRAHAALQGIKQGGMLNCLKHFPGQGDAQFDTHLKGAHIPMSRGEFEQHLRPFRDLSQHADMMMISHASYSCLGEVEACFHHTLLNHTLRDELKFKGVIVSDDLTMGAIDQKQQGEVAIRAIAAGCDLLLVCEGLEHWKTLCTALTNESAKSPSFAVRLHDAAQRVCQLRQKLSH